MSKLKSKIRIKKENRGKFTDYCGGKVTQDCIDKAKKSGNKKLVKRATFAENARKWKHQNGGVLKAQMGLQLMPYTNGIVHKEDMPFVKKLAMLPLMEFGYNPFEKENKSNVNTGAAPIPSFYIGSLPKSLSKYGPEALDYIRKNVKKSVFGAREFFGDLKALKKIDAAEQKAIRAAERESKKLAKKSTTSKQKVKEVYNIKTGQSYKGPLPEGWENLTPREGWAIREVWKDVK